jgi:hypothetical protein
VSRRFRTKNMNTQFKWRTQPRERCRKNTNEEDLIDDPKTKFKYQIQMTSIFLANDRFNRLSKYLNSNKQIIIYVTHVNKNYGMWWKPSNDRFNRWSKNQIQMTTSFFLQMIDLTDYPNTKIQINKLFYMWCMLT